MIENLEEEKVFYSNKSSSSSTSSLLSYSSVSSHQMPFAPPPTPLLATMQRANESQATIPIYQLQQQQQQPTSANNLLMISAVQPQAQQQYPTTTMLTSTTSDQSIFHSAVNNNNSNNNNGILNSNCNVISLTSTVGAANSLNNNSSLIDFNTHHSHADATKHKHSLFVENSSLFGHSSSSDFSLGSNSSRVKAHSNRRECKSTSDESYTIELEEQSLIASATNKIEKMCNASSSSSSSTNGDNYSHLYKLNGGQFGYSPCSRRASALLSPHFNNKRSEQYSMMKLALKSDKSLSNNSKQHKKVVKRLSSNVKFFTENLKNSTHDFTHNKKLFTSVLNNDYKTVCEMLDSNMYDVNCVDDKQRTCLHIASSRGNIEIVRMLLEYGANPNIRDCVNNLPIHLAIISSHVQVVTLLLEAGTDIHSLDLNGKTVLHLAGTRLRWLLNDENNQASPKLKFEAIMIMNMIKEYLRRKKTSTDDLDKLTSQLENTFNLDDINNITKEFLSQFETLNI